MALITLERPSIASISSAEVVLLRYASSFSLRYGMPDDEWEEPGCCHMIDHMTSPPLIHLLKSMLCVARKARLDD